MFCYKEQHNLSHLHGHPEEELAHWLDAHPSGLGTQLSLSHALVRAGFSVRQRTSRIALYAMAMEQLSVSECFARLLHELRGNDAQHLDVEEETIPQKAWIGSQTTANTHQTQLDLFDYSALLKTSRQVVTDICTLLADGQQRSVHKENRALLEQLQQREENIRKELERLAEAADPHRCADFHLGEESAFDLNASNYFDRPNPQFFCERRIQGGKDGHADGGHLSK